MKKIFNFILTIAILTILTGCKNNNISTNSNIENNKINIVTTIFPAYDFARQIAGENADITLLIKPGAETHSFDPTPQDIKKIQNCDLFIYNGGENDVWVDEILNSMEDKKPTTLKMMDCVELVEEKITENMEHDDEHSHDNELDDEHNEEHSHDGELDEHVWTSPKNAIKIAEKIDKTLEKIDPQNATIYSQNTKNFISQLEILDKNLEEVVASSKRNILIFGDRFPFTYLAKDYDLDYFAAFSGCSTQTDASPSTIAFLIDKVNENQIPVVFTIELSNGKIADSICDATNAKKLTLHSCHNLSAEDFENGETYISLMEQNVQNIKEALN